ncbi:hypothetical protein HCN73_05015 [Lactobacillus crispatus]|uniref:hypothetical protein n=1 Tax=Lactobacillus crispatus TaxID=47770 RepID=UPI0015EC385A|nr:hypothetical protein [Lactobacillus crispatus]MBA2915544.1 hypothetical protein [Lactobacillus crispatus]MBA2915704.1 hypothetical protein [Lactobacillus crispatus]
MHGKIIQFKAEIDNFKVKNGLVTVNLTADTKDIVLDQLSEVSSGLVMVNLEASQTELLPEEANKNADH